MLSIDNIFMLWLSHCHFSKRGEKFSMEQSMKAVGFRRFGPANVLETLDVPKPTLTSHTVLIRVGAASVNPGDWQIRNGRFRFFIRSRLPFIPGADVAGTVEQVGSDVTRFHPGDAVYAMLPLASGGGYAEYAAVDDFLVVPLPPDLSVIEAAAVPLAALTALQALRDKAHLQRNAHLLLNGASGGVGLFALQIAKIMGARVTAVCSERNAELVRRFGADEIRDYSHEDITAGEARYDVIFDTRDNHPFWKWQKILRSKGVLVSVNPVLGNPMTQLLVGLRGRRLKSMFVHPSGTDLEILNGWIIAGQLRPVIDQWYQLADAVVAHRYSETARVRGKLVLIVDENQRKDSNTIKVLHREEEEGKRK